MNPINKLGLWAIVSIGLAANPLNVSAQSTDSPLVEKKASTPASPAAVDKATKAGPFHGKLAALDKVAKTITVGKRTFQITSETKIKKAGKPAILEEGIVGETVSGYVKPTADGKLLATTVNFGAKQLTDSPEKVKAGPEKEKLPK